MVSFWTRVGKGSNEAFFRVGAKRFMLAFDCDRSAPYHIMERRGKFVGYLWLGFEGLWWLLAEWAFLRTCIDLKGFFRFYRSGYSILEFSCLENQHGRFVELAKYQGGAQRGGIRVLEGYRGKGWARFESRLINFFLGQSARAKENGNGTTIPRRKELDSRNPPAKLAHPAGEVKSSNPWDPRVKTLRITKLTEGKRQVEWVGLKHKAQGLIRLENWALPQAHDPLDGSRDPVRPDLPNLDLPSTSRDPVSPDSVRGGASGNIGMGGFGFVGSWYQGEMVAVGLPSFSDSHFDMGGPSNWVVEPTEAGGVSLPIVLFKDSDGDVTSPLQCVPLASVGPPSDLDVVEEHVLESSQWVKWRHRGFCKLVGFPIEQYEQECLALLQRIEADRFANKATSETKLADIDLQLVRSLWGNSFVDWEMLPTLGTCWWGLYGPTNDGIRNELWTELSSVRLKWDLPWCVFGDFNVSNLVDLPLGGGPYTWSSGLDHPSMSRLHRFLVSTDWEDFYLDVCQKRMPRPLSDHYPILLEVGGMLRGKSPFRFENMWLKSEGFVDRVQGSWSSYSFSGPPSFVLACKLKALKEDLKKWNQLEFGSSWDPSSQFRRTWLIWMKLRGGKNLVFSGLRKGTEGWQPFVDELPFSMIDDSDRTLLDSRFEKEEIIGVVYEHDTFAYSLNATFVTLIPKKRNASNIKDFQPISLVRSVYKILAKVLANRLKRVLAGLVSESQNAFLDIEKAYDHVNWDCLLHLLERMGFGFRWSTWIRTCISTVRFSIMVNGSPLGFFGSSRGLRQGDPLSPLLFLLIMEVLSQMLRRTEEEGLIRGFKAGKARGNGLSISHLLFANDTIVFCDAIPDQLLHLHMVLGCFETVTGLGVNMGKSELVPVGEVNNVSVLADILCCKVGALPMTYLASLGGVEYGVSPPCSWCGLGVRKVALMNRALLGKWMWWFGMEETHLWRRVIAEKYGVEGRGWFSKTPKGPHGCGLWKGIMSGWDFFSQKVRMIAGRGNRILFWHDLWCGETPLKTLFPVLFSCSSNKTASIESLIRPRVGEARVWNITFIRDFNDWELDELLNFFHLIHSKIPREECPDAMSWSLHNHGRFEAKSFYHALSGQSDSTFPWKAVWKVKAPRRVAFFVWTAAWGKILTCDNFNEERVYHGWLVLHV
uniref:Reverse transcriptase domain-containing protein n=1 Tax=Fagus sylvatica TaxID=28930 RepID=A0A2N9GD56_FAGSY